LKGSERVITQKKNNTLEGYKYNFLTLLATLFLIYMIFFRPEQYAGGLPIFFVEDKHYLNSIPAEKLNINENNKNYYGLIIENEKADYFSDILLFVDDEKAFLYKNVIENNINYIDESESAYFLERKYNKYNGFLSNYNPMKDNTGDPTEEESIVIFRNKQKYGYNLISYKNKKLYSRDKHYIEAINIPKNGLKTVQELPLELSSVEVIIRNTNSFGFNDYIKDLVLKNQSPLRTIVMLMFFPLYLIFVHIAYVEPTYQKMKRKIKNKKHRKKIEKKKKSNKHQLTNNSKLVKDFKYSDEIFEMILPISFRIKRKIDTQGNDTYYFVISDKPLKCTVKNDEDVYLYLKLYDVTNADQKKEVYFIKDYIPKKKSNYKVKNNRYLVHMRRNLTNFFKKSNEFMLDGKLCTFEIPIEKINYYEGGIRKYCAKTILLNGARQLDNSIVFTFKFPKNI